MINPGSLVNEDKQIVTFDTLGYSVRTVGRAGSGPGELQFPGSIFAEADGTVGVFDYGKQGIGPVPGGRFRPPNYVATCAGDALAVDECPR